MTIVRGTVVTMNPAREIIGDGAVVISGDTIAAVGSFDDLRAAHPDANVSGHSGDLVLPGYVNGHQHLTGDRLIQSSIPDDLPPGEAIFSWVVPVHGEHSPADDELSATLTLAEALSNGITTTFEAGTVAHPDRVVAAAQTVGARATVGTWGWDVDEGPFAGSVEEVIDRQRAALDLATGPRVSTWVSLVGHDLMSDELVVAASELARSRGVGMTFHLSPTTSDVDSYLARTGLRPLVHLSALGVLGSHVAVAHGVHLDAQEVGVLVNSRAAVVSCPWAYLRLGQGLTVSSGIWTCGAKGAGWLWGATPRTPATWLTGSAQRPCSQGWRRTLRSTRRSSVLTMRLSCSPSPVPKPWAWPIASARSKSVNKPTSWFTTGPVSSGFPQAPIRSCNSFGVATADQ